MNQTLPAASVALEAALVQAQALAGLGYYRWSKSQQRLIACNDEYRRILGQPADSHDASGIGPYLHPEDRERVIEAHRAAEAAGRAVHLEFRIRHPDGSLRFLRDLNQPEPNPAGPPDIWFGTVQDITDLKQREMQLAESETARERAADLAKLAYYRWSIKQGRYLQLSRQYFEILGIPPESPPLGSDYIDPYLHPDDREAVLRQRQIAEAEGPPLDLQYRILRPDGGLRYIHEIAETRPGPDGGPDIYTGTLQDVTGLKQMEEELLQSQKMQSIGTFAGGIAHSLNNLLLPILGYIELAMEDFPAESRQRTNLATALDAGEQARQLVQQILAFSRRERTQRRPIKPAALVEEILFLLRSVLPGSVEIRRDIDTAAPTIMADATELYQVFLNLASNAAAAMGMKGGVFSVRVAPRILDTAFCTAHPELEPGRFVEFAVSDTGCGISAEVVGRIFEPFFTTKGVGDGTGLGLSVVHGIVAAYRGAILVDSELQRGTTFTMYLPAA
jgi:PAS domain S-box-containing protein